MPLRLLETHVPEDLAEQTETLLQEVGAVVTWQETGGPFGRSVKGVIGAGRTGRALDHLHERLSPIAGFRVLVTTLDAVLPRPAAGAPEFREVRTSAEAVSHEEVYASVQDATRLTPTYVTMVVLATGVAAIGLARNNVAAVIGAMVVAPLLGPNMGLALGFTLGDRVLIRDAIRASLAGIATAFAMAILLGWMLAAGPEVPEIGARTRVALTDLLLAFAAGAAGTLAYTSGVPTYLVGVMVAVALLPPTVASGLLIGTGHLREASGAALLVATNVAALNLAGMLTFSLVGLRPRHWWGEEQARRSARLGIAFFTLLVALLGLLIVLSRAPLGN